MVITHSDRWRVPKRYDILWFVCRNRHHGSFLSVELAFVRVWGQEGLLDLFALRGSWEKRQEFSGLDASKPTHLALPSDGKRSYMPPSARRHYGLRSAGLACHLILV